MNIEQKIIQKFLTSYELKYSEIWDKDIPSNKFTYHLQKVVDKGLIERTEETYKLTEEGKRYISFLDGSEVLAKPKPLPCVFIVAQDDEGKILFHERKRQPFLGKHGLPGGKIEFGEFLEDEAAKELFEETGLKGDLTLKLVTNYITYNSNSSEVTHHLLGYFYLATNLTGNLIKENDECKNFFVALENINMKEVFPDLPIVIPKVIENKDIEFLQAKRFMKDNEFGKIEFI